MGASLAPGLAGLASGTTPRYASRGELRDAESDLASFRLRLAAAALAVVVAFALLVTRLVWLQVVRHDELAEQAESNRTAVVPIVPNRGLIVDRHGEVLASNYSAYTLELTPSKLGAPLEQTIDQLAEVVDISTRDRRRFRRLLEENKAFDSLPLRTRLTDEEVARFTVQKFRFPGVEVRARLFRNYPLGEVGAHLIGYIGRINADEKKAMEDWDDELQSNYRGTDVIGKLGLEQRYERELHGNTGFDELETAAGGRAVRRLGSRPATAGHNLQLAVDIRLQHLVELLFGARRGALVAIDPRNGEVLALVSKPTFDPNLFVDGIDADNWRELNESLDRPLLNRALKGTYPPGSTFKPFMAMAGLASGKRTASQIVMDGGTFTLGGHTFRSHGDRGLGPVDLRRSIVKSSNVYYYSLANEMGVDLMHAQLSPFGFGRRTGIDLDGEVTGVLPSTAWKRAAYRKPEQQKWYAGETVSLGIGQGYNNFTMVQLAHALATLVSGGQRHEPRLVRQIVDASTRSGTPSPRQDVPPLALDADHVALVMEAMYGVTQEGTSTRIFAGAPYQTGGKTGTAQAVSMRRGERYDAARLEEYQRDHSLYVAFAPLSQPTVALAVVVENAGFGAAAAAPIARRVFDYLLLGQWPSDEDIAATQQGRSAAPIGTPRRATDIAWPPVAAASAAPAAAASASPVNVAASSSTPVATPTVPPAARATPAVAAAAAAGTAR